MCSGLIDVSRVLLLLRPAAAAASFAALAAFSGSPPAPCIAGAPAARSAAPSSTAPAQQTAPSCAGPADPALTPERVRLMLQGDDTYPSEDIRRLAPGVVPALITLATTSDDNYARSRAISLLGDVGCRETAPVVEKLLADPDPMMRLPATVSIATLLGADATPILVRMLSDTDRGVVKYALKGLARVGDNRALPELTRFMKTNSEDWLRDLAAQASAQASAEIRRRAK
jgi:hypothetical protein